MKITNVNNYRVVVKVDKTEEVAKLEKLITKSSIILTDNCNLELERNTAFSKSCTGILTQVGDLAFNGGEGQGSKIGDRVLFPRDEGIIVTEHHDDGTIDWYRIISDSQVLCSVELQDVELKELAKEAE